MGLTRITAEGLEENLLPKGQRLAFPRRLWLWLMQEWAYRVVGKDKNPPVWVVMRASRCSCADECHITVAYMHPSKRVMRYVKRLVEAHTVREQGRSANDKIAVLLREMSGHKLEKHHSKFDLQRYPLDMACELDDQLNKELSREVFERVVPINMLDGTGVQITDAGGGMNAVRIPMELKERLTRAVQVAEAEVGGKGGVRSEGAVGGDAQDNARIQQADAALRRAPMRNIRFGPNK